GALRPPVRVERERAGAEQLAGPAPRGVRARTTGRAPRHAVPGGPAAPRPPRPPRTGRRGAARPPARRRGRAPAGPPPGGTAAALAWHRWAQGAVADRSQARARVIGGCSSHNACALVRGEPRDYDEWPEGWRAADLEPYLDRAEKQLSGRVFPDEELSPWHRA